MDQFELENKVEKLEQRIDEIYHEIHILQRHNDATDFKLDNIFTVVQELRTDVKSIMAQPNKRWDTIITVGITGIVMYLLTNISTILSIK